MDQKQKSVRRLFFIIIGLMIFLIMVIGTERRLVKKIIQDRHDGKVASFRYNRESSGGKRYYLIEYELENGNSCIAYHEYERKWLVARQVGSYALNHSCYVRKLDYDTIEFSDYLYDEHRQSVEFTLFGHNNQEYEAFIIKFDWGDEIRVEIPDEKGLYLSYHRIKLPNEEVNLNNFYDHFRVEKIRRK